MAGVTSNSPTYYTDSRCFVTAPDGTSLDLGVCRVWQAVGFPRSTRAAEQCDVMLHLSRGLESLARS